MLIYNISLIRLSEGLYVNLLMICLFWIGSLGKYLICFIFLEFGWNGTLDTENSDAPLSYWIKPIGQLWKSNQNFSTMLKEISKLPSLMLSNITIIRINAHEPAPADIEVNMVANITREVATITKEVAAIFFEPKCFKSKLLRAKPYSGVCIF